MQTISSKEMQSLRMDAANECAGEPLVAVVSSSSSSSRRKFLRTAGTAGMAISVAGLAPHASAASGRGSMFVVCIGDPGDSSRSMTNGTQNANNAIPGNYFWQGNNAVAVDDFGPSALDSLKVTVSGSGPKKKAKAGSFTLTGLVTADYVQSDLNGVSNYSVSKQKNQVVQIVNGALAFTPNPATDDATDDQRSTLKVRIDIKDGVVLGTASDTSQAIANWTITGTPPYISLSSPNGTPVDTVSKVLEWTFALMDQQAYDTWLAQQTA